MSFHDEFDDPPGGGPLGFLGQLGPKVAFFAVLIALSFMIGVVWKLYWGADQGQGQNVPIVRADADGFKVTPSDPGGEDIPHQDSTIFSTLKAQRAEQGTKIENLLADNEEQPLPRSQLFAGLNTDEEPVLDASSSDQKTESSKAATKKAPPALKADEARLNLALPKKVDPVTPVQEKKKERPKAAPVPAPKKATAKPQPLVPQKREVASSTASSSGAYYIQLGSVKSRTGAEGEWKKLLKKYAPQLSGFSHRVETADLGAKGVFYRIQAGPVSKDEAVKVCTSIKKVTPGGCLVTK